MELIAQVVLVLLGSAIPAFGAAWFTHRGGEVLADAFRPMSGQRIALNEAWPRGVQEEEPRPWGSAVAAKRIPMPDGGLETPSEAIRMPDLRPVRRGDRPSPTYDRTGMPAVEVSAGSVSYGTPPRIRLRSGTE